jgi:hypothetical protein
MAQMGRELCNILYSWKSKTIEKVLLHKHIALELQRQKPYKHLGKL